MSKDQRLTNYINYIITLLSENYVNVEADIKAYVVNFTSGEFKHRLCQVKIETLKDSLKTGELPTTIKRLVK